MDLSVESEENLEYMIAEIKKRLQLVNQDLIRAESFSLEQYDDIHDIYALVKRKPSFTVAELEGVLDALRILKTK